MASIIDSIRSVCMDNYAFIRMGIFSYAIYFLYGLIDSTNNVEILNIILYSVILFIYLGFCTIIISNRINQRIETLPNFNIPQFISVAMQATLIGVPYMFIGYFVVDLVIGLFNFESIPQLIAIWMTRFFIFSIYITALINYAQNYRTTDGLNISKIVNGLADVMAYTLIALLLQTIVFLLAAAPTLYLIYTFFKFGALFQYIAIFVLTVNLAILADYWGQLHFEIESRNNYY